MPHNGLLLSLIDPEWRHGEIFVSSTWDNKLLTFLETVKGIICNTKLNKGYEEILALIDFVSEANLISQEYSAELTLKISDISWSLATIIKQQTSKNGIGMTDFEKIANIGQTFWFEEIFLIENVPQKVILSVSFLNLENSNISWTAFSMQLGKWNEKIALMTTN